MESIRWAFQEVAIGKCLRKIDEVTHSELGTKVEITEPALKYINR